jgi:hypothetical protein
MEDSLITKLEKAGYSYDEIEIILDNLEVAGI